MNAVARLWEALAAGDRHRAAEELHGHVVVDRPHTNERFDSRDAYLSAYDALGAAGRLELRRAVTQGRSVATEVHITDDHGVWAVAAFFHLHDGRIQHGVEYWVRLP